MKSRIIGLAFAVWVAACGMGSTTEDQPLQPGTTSEQGLHINLRGLTRFERHDLVSDQQEGAAAVDSHLINAWGLAFAPQGVAWVSAADGHVANVYSADGKILMPAVSIPGVMGQPGSPTGQVHNDNPNAFSGDRFILVTEEGLVVGWQPSVGSEAMKRIDNSARSSSYKGAALASFRGQGRLYAADFFNGAVDVFDESYGPVQTRGGFVDRDLPVGYSPFNIQAVNGALVVTFAKQSQKDKGEEDHGAGLGFVDLFDGDGRLVARLASGGSLNAPWGVAMTPVDFGRLPNRLLIGNFGDGRINVFALGDTLGRIESRFDGQLTDLRARPIQIDGLWSLQFGPGAGGFDSHTLYFTAGPGDEMHGVFGALELVTQ
jgi:uncharacterized protein (TIGR03118 family)